MQFRVARAGFAVEIVFEACLAMNERREHERAVGNGLVRWYANRAAQWLGGVRDAKFGHVYFNVCLKKSPITRGMFSLEWGPAFEKLQWVAPSAGIKVAGTCLASRALFNSSAWACQPSASEAIIKNGGSSGEAYGYWAEAGNLRIVKRGNPMHLIQFIRRVGVICFEIRNPVEHGYGLYAARYIRESEIAIHICIGISNPNHRTQVSAATATEHTDMVRVNHVLGSIRPQIADGTFHILHANRQLEIRWFTPIQRGDYKSAFNQRAQ